jgi:hypothetical protein
MEYNNFTSLNKNVKINFLEYLGVTKVARKILKQFKIDQPSKIWEPFTPIHLFLLVLNEKGN